MAVKKNIHCAHCGISISRTATLVRGLGRICPTCLAEKYIICDDCGKPIPKADAKAVCNNYASDGLHINREEKITLFFNAHQVEYIKNVTSEERIVCGHCASHYHVCIHCGAVHRSDTPGAKSPKNKEYVCPNCIKERYTACSECNTWTDNRDMVSYIIYSAPEGEPVLKKTCQKCASNMGLRRCDNCGDRYAVTYTPVFIAALRNTSVCPVCRSSMHVYACGHYTFRADDADADAYTITPGDIFESTLLPEESTDADGCQMSQTPNPGAALRSLIARLGAHEGDSICSSCYASAQRPRDDDQKKYIHGYNFSTTLFTHKLSGNDDITLGIELEVDSHYRDGDRHCENAARDVYKNVGAKHVLIKHDGSLGAGFEMVTHPATLAYMLDNRDRYGQLCSIPRNAGFRSHDLGTCGLHIHVGREWFTPDALATIGALTEMYWPELYIFSRRNEERASQWAHRYFSTETQLEVGANPPVAIERIAKYIQDHTGDGHDSFRYHTYNVCNDKTVEFRLFRGTLRESTFWASIQLIDNLVRFGRTITDDNITITAQKIMDSHWLDIVGYTHYPELDAYNAKRVGDEWHGDRELEIATLGGDTVEDNIASTEHVVIPDSIKIGRIKVYTWYRYKYSKDLICRLSDIIADRPCFIIVGLDRVMADSMAIFRKSALLGDIITRRMVSYFYICTERGTLSEGDAGILAEILGDKKVSDWVEDTYTGFIRG